ncbi:MAG: NPCBM/NEW2 domain-containing protein [Verrucomicrobia bacterium]|nr:NPCBM/NEW2 domain-containing protein [Verrucomicrobiota bacterium]
MFPPVSLLRICLTFFLLGAESALAWGEPHHAITRAAVGVLPLWEREVLGEEAKALGDRYCLIPDQVFTDRENAKFAAMESAPGEVYLQILHLPGPQTETLEVVRSFMERAVQALREGRTSDAAKYMGTICHQIEDYGSPSHTLPGDNQFTLLQQFLPPGEAMRDQLVHGPIENGVFEVDLAGYHPVLLGASVAEASWRLLHRMHEAILNARSTTIPILQALYAEDGEGVVKHQLRAAVVDGQVLADALHTIICLGTGKVAPPESLALDRVGIAGFFPLEAPALHYPQTEFFSLPHWGYPRSGVILAGGKRAMPLTLRTEGGPKEFRQGLSAGMGKTLTYLLPRGVWRSFGVLAGLHPELGAKGRVEFTISGDGRVLASVTVGGEEAARKMECAVNDITRLQLSLTSRGIDGKSAYAIWGEPMLAK